MATTLPMLYDPTVGEHGVLYGHIARANPQWQTPPVTDALAIFTGPDAYITPSWYAAKATDGKVVPTWNYVTVHAYGAIEFLDDAASVLDIVTRLTQRHEQQRPAPWAVDEAPADYIAAQLRGIIGIRMALTRIDAKAKMSQNRSPEDRERMAADLQASPHEAERLTGAWVKKTLP
jgi:transcriptional regulator